MTGQLHGGDRYRNHVKLDFSVNTNPLGMPDYIKEVLRNAVSESPELCEWYPDPQCDRLRDALSACHGIPKENIVCGNGACELITAIVRAQTRLPAKQGGFSEKGRTLRVLLPVPSFGEYERALACVGAQCIYHTLEKEDGFRITESILEKLTPDMDMLFLCSPNNPTGTLIPEKLLRQIVRRCAESRITLVLDECFRELTIEEESETAEAAYKSSVETVSGNGGKRSDCCLGMIRLKAFTKLYAMPGLRLGYCICEDGKAAEQIKEQLPCWNVSGIAQLAGVTALDNEKMVDYISQTKQMLRMERNWLVGQLELLGMKVVPGCANFICFYAEPYFYGSLYEKLLEKEILIRDCGSFRSMEEGWYRIAVKTHTENELLIEKLQSI